MIPWLGIIAIVGLLSIISTVGFFIYDFAKTTKIHGLIISKLEENRSISNSDLRAFLVTRGVNISLNELSLRRTNLEPILDELLKQKREHVLLERSFGIKLIVSLEVVGGFFNLIVGIIDLWVFTVLTRFGGSNAIFGIPLNMLIALFAILGLILLVLSILGFDLAFRFWGGKDSAWTTGLVHTCVCLAMGIFTLPIGIFSILIYIAIIYCLTRSDVKVLSKAVFVSEKEEVYIRPPTIYEKLVDLYSKIYGLHGKRKLDKKIEAYINKGFTQGEAIQKVAKEEGYK